MSQEEKDVDQQSCDYMTPCLYLWGVAWLEYQHEPVRLSHKGLAILYYLALQGPTRREVLADLLWEHAEAAQNLRVTLSQLRKALMFLDEPPFPQGENPLRFPEGISLEQTKDARHKEVMEGLDDISVPFQAWLEEQRGRFHFFGVRTDLRDKLVREVSQQLSPPCLLVLQGSLGAGKLSFAQSLAQMLKLPCYSGLRGRGVVGVHHLKPPHPENTFAYVTAHQNNIWVIDQEAFGEESELILRLLEYFPTEQVHYLELPRLSWFDVKKKDLAELPLADAVALYLAADGRPGYLAEYREWHRQHSLAHHLHREVVPQRLRAIFQLRARELSLDARLALERLSVHPGSFSDGLIDTFEAKPHLEELERLGWITFDQNWSFVEEVLRRVLVNCLQAGRKRNYHLMAAGYFANEQQPLAEAYHAMQAGESPDLEVLSQQLSDWQLFALRAHYHLPVQLAPLASEACGLGSELMPTESWHEGSVDVDGCQLAFVRNVLERLPSRVAWQLPNEPCLLRFAGNAFVDNALAVGLEGDALPLELEVIGAPSRRVTWLPSLPEPSHTSERLLLPLSSAFESHLLLPAGTTIVLTCCAEAGLIELEFTVHHAVEVSKITPGLPQVQVFNPSRTGTIA